MTLFFLVVGLEARREFDLGDLRDRRRFCCRCAAGSVGMVVPVAIYLRVQPGGPRAHGWGVGDVHRHRPRARPARAPRAATCPTGPRLPAHRVRRRRPRGPARDRGRCTPNARGRPLLMAVGVFGAAARLQRSASSRGSPSPRRWCGSLLCETGVDPVVTGLAIGLTASAYTPARGEPRRAPAGCSAFREQPTAELARTASVGLTRRCRPTSGCSSSTTRGPAT